MVLYYGRAKTRTGSVNTNQLGLKMSGCPSKVGRKGYISRYIARRVSCSMGVCGFPKVHGVRWRHSLRNTIGYCRNPSSKCAAAAGGIGNINTPYYRTTRPGQFGCTQNVPAGKSYPTMNNVARLRT